MPATKIIPVDIIHRPLRIIRTVEESLASDQAAQERLMAGTHVSKSYRMTTKMSPGIRPVNRTVVIRRALMALMTLPGISNLDKDLLMLFVSRGMSAVAEWAEVIMEGPLARMEMFISMTLNASVSKTTRMRVGRASWRTKRRSAVVGVILASIPEVIDQRAQASGTATTGVKTASWKSMSMSRFRRTGVTSMDLRHGNAGREMLCLLEDAACIHALGNVEACPEETLCHRDDPFDHESQFSQQFSSLAYPMRFSTLS